MNTVAFDTLEYSQMLQDAGVPREQAEAFTKANAKAFSSMVITQQLATKQDIEGVRHEIDQVRREIDQVRREIEANRHEILKWVVTAMIAQTALLVGIIAFLR